MRLAQSRASSSGLQGPRVGFQSRLINRFVRRSRCPKRPQRGEVSGKLGLVPQQQMFSELEDYIHR